MFEMKRLRLLSLFVLFANTAMAENPSGTCGTNCNWVLENGKLSITGGANGEIGTMDDYQTPWDSERETRYNTSPWKDYAESITSVDVKGVTNIGNGAFGVLRNVTSANIGDTITSIGSLAFYDTNLTSVEFPDSLKYVGGWAFVYNNNLVSVKCPDSLESIGGGAFWAHGGNLDINIPDTADISSHYAFGTRNVNIVCMGSEETCAAMRQRLSHYCINTGVNGCQKEEDFIDLSGNVVLANESQCNSAKYYWTGGMCSNRPTDGSAIECDEGWYVTNKDVCARIKLRYTLPEADKATSNDNENMIEWIFE